MSIPLRTDEELTRVAEALHAEGELSIRRLRARAGGGDTKRLMRIAQAVREAPVETDPHACGTSEGDQRAEELLPRALENEFARLQAAVRSQMDMVRAGEAERARASEAALAARHETELAAAAAESALLREDVADLEQAVAAYSEQIDELTTSRTLVEEALTRSEDDRRAAAQAHSQERIALTETVAKLQDVTTQATEARVRAEAELRQTASDGTRLRSELERERVAVVELHSRLDELEHRCLSAERERNEAITRQDELTARVAKSDEELRVAMLEAAALRGQLEAHQTLARLLEQVQAADNKQPAERPTRRRKRKAGPPSGST